MCDRSPVAVVSADTWSTHDEKAWRVEKPAEGSVSIDPTQKEVLVHLAAPPSMAPFDLADQVGRELLAVVQPMRQVVGLLGVVLEVDLEVDQVEGLAEERFVQSDQDHTTGFAALGEEETAAPRFAQSPAQKGVSVHPLAAEVASQVASLEVEVECSHVHWVQT